jgi:hypothetical protein
LNAPFIPRKISRTVNHAPRFPVQPVDPGGSSNQGRLSCMQELNESLRRIGIHLFHWICIFSWLHGKEVKMRHSRKYLFIIIPALFIALHAVALG